MRPTFASALIVTSALLVGTPSASGDQRLLRPPQPKAARNPYGKLFAVQSVEAKQPQSKPKVVCGMTMIPGDANVDRGIQMRRDPSDTRHSIRALEPPVCSAAR